MPLYVYTCPTCEIELEELRPRARADEPVPCPICSDMCTREISAFAARNRQQETPCYASPQQVQRAMHGPACGCCRPRRF